MVTILVVLNLVTALFLIMAQSKQRKETEALRGLYQKVNDNHVKILLETAHLKKSVEQVQTLAEQALSVNAIGEETSSSIKYDADRGTVLKERYKNIFDLHDEGLTVEQIARKLGKGYEEVSYVLEFAGEGK